MYMPFLLVRVDLSSDAIRHICEELVALTPRSTALVARRKELVEEHGVSLRALQRYEAEFRKNQKHVFKTAGRPKKRPNPQVVLEEIARRQATQRSLKTDSFPMVCLTAAKKQARYMFLVSLCHTLSFDV